MKFFRMLLAGGTVLAAAGTAQAGSSITYTGMADGSPSIVTMGDSWSKAIKSYGVTRRNIMSYSPEMPANKPQSAFAGDGPGVKVDAGMKKVAEKAPAKESAPVPAMAEDAQASNELKPIESGIDTTVTASAPEKEPSLEAAPFSTSELRQ
jgi:hypothetical protein